MHEDLHFAFQECFAEVRLAQRALTLLGRELPDAGSHEQFSAVVSSGGANSPVGTELSAGLDEHRPVVRELIDCLVARAPLFR